MPDAAELRRLPMPPPDRAERRTPAREPASAATAVPTTPAVEQVALVQRGSLSRVEPPVLYGVVESGGAARDDARLELGTVRRSVLPALTGSVEKVLDDLLGRLNLGRPASGGSIEKVLGDLLGRLNRRLDPDARLERGTVRGPKVPGLDGSIGKVRDDLSRRLNRRLDRAVSGEPKRRVDPDLTVNRKRRADPDPTANRQSRLDNDVPENRNRPVDTDVPVNRKRPVDTEGRSIDPPDSRPTEKPKIQANPAELRVNRRARAADSLGAASRRERSPERRVTRPPRLDPPIQRAASRQKAVSRRRGLTPRG